MTRPEKNVEQEKPQGVPAWIVSFSDMVTLLLAFFVLLQSFAKEPTPELFYAGRNSFKRAVSGMGLPTWLLGQKPKPKMQKHINKHESEPDEDPLSRNKILDADDATIRELFDKLSRDNDSQSSDLNQELISAVATPIHFAVGRNRLNAAAKRYLDERVVELRQNLADQFVRINIIGLAVNGSSTAEKLFASARRASAVEQYLRGKLSDELKGSKWKISSWGSGSSNEWTASYGHQPKDASIIIAVMGAK